MNRRAFSAGALACAVAGAVAFAAAHANPEEASGSKQPAPNVIVVMMDDLSVAEQPYMREINSRIGRQGAVFANSFTNFPLCCPSRATFLTGQYSQNHRVRGNATPEGGYPVLDHSNTLPVWLQEAGYYTGLIGKYMNMYEQQPQPETIPPGWDHWAGTTKTYYFYDYQFNENGTLTDYGDDPSDYQADVVTNKALDLIAERAPEKQPFFLWLTYLAPHSGGPDPNPNPPADCGEFAKPAPRYAHAFDDIVPPRTPSFGEKNISDKPSWVKRPKFTQTDIDYIRQNFRCRVEASLAVDEGVGEILDELKATGELDNTYVVYTSDNGFMLGQHRLRQGKNFVYEQSIRVPLMIRGPEIPARTRVRELVTNADVPATILELTGAEPGLPLDGRSLRPLIARPRIERGRELLIQVRFRKTDPDRNAWAIRNHRYLFARFDNGERELYDLDRDPDERTNLAGDPRYRQVQRLLDRRLHKLRRCDGAECSLLPKAEIEIGPPPPGSRLCRRKPGSATVVGENHIGSVTFRFGPGPATIDRTKPFLLRLNPLLRKRERTLHARVELLDGRVADLARSVSACAKAG